MHRVARPFGESHRAAEACSLANLHRNRPEEHTLSGRPPRGLGSRSGRWHNRHSKRTARIDRRPRSGLRRSFRKPVRRPVCIQRCHKKQGWARWACAMACIPREPSPSASPQGNTPRVRQSTSLSQGRVMRRQKRWSAEGKKQVKPCGQSAPETQGTRRSAHAPPSQANPARQSLESSQPPPTRRQRLISWLHM